MHAFLSLCLTIGGFRLNFQVRHRNSAHGISTHPQVQEIRECIQETLAAIRDFSLKRPGEVVRQSAFGIFMCGILSESEAVLKSVELHMMWHCSGEESSMMVSDFLRRFWDETRMQPGGQLVRWRQLLSNEGILLAGNGYP